MQGVGEWDTDIKLDQNGQLIIDGTGDAALVEGTDCWQQDLWLESQTEERELFYEDSTGDDSFGFGLLDFLQREYDSFTEEEIQQRIRDKFSKRTFLDPASVQIMVSHNEGIYGVKITFQKNKEDQKYNLNLTIDNVEVILE